MKNKAYNVKAGKASLAKFVGRTTLGACLLLSTLGSCSDILDTGSDSQVFNPSLSEPIDSMYYTLGILKGVQQAIDQNVIVNEMRGDLTQTNANTELDLRSIANFSAKAGNKYDSAYVYYRIINNCNYYIAHRDTSLRTGSQLIAIPEYVQAKAIRAWVYIQLARNYGSVPFYTTPLGNVSEGMAVNTYKDIYGIADSLAADLEQYSGMRVPNYGNIDAYHTNAGENKTVASQMMMFPVDLVLGDLYLESGQYEKAANYYYKYLSDNQLPAYLYQASVNLYPDRQSLPSDILTGQTASAGAAVRSWANVYRMNAPQDVITYVPMAVNKLQGTVSDLPNLFGYNVYYSNALGNGRYNENPQIDASDSLLSLSSGQPYYYAIVSNSGVSTPMKAEIGDMRRYAELTSHVISTGNTDKIFYNMNKFNGTNIPVYRASVIYLKLAEAINRLGYPDAAFAILKDGLGEASRTDTTYMREDTHYFMNQVLGAGSTYTFTGSHGIHAHGCGYTGGGSKSSLYQYGPVVLEKMNSIAEKFGFAAADSSMLYGPRAIDAVEDLICDEYALEAAFEGSRFGDLMRIARHKNADNIYDSNYGGRWLARKLEFKNPVVDLTDERNWFLPLK